MKYQFTLTGQTPIFVHADDVMASDHLTAWRKDPKNKDLSVPGDDRSPPWTWQTYLYHDGEHLAVPQENIMACLRKAAAQVQMPKGRKSFKELSQSGLMIEGEYCDFLSRGKRIPRAAIVAMASMSFHDQFEAVKELGFELKVKRAKVGQSKHVRVRAVFRAWSVVGTINVSEPVITLDVLKQLFEIGGRYVGLMDWRPGSPQSPGPYGIFGATLKPL